MYHKRTGFLSWTLIGAWVFVFTGPLSKMNQEWGYSLLSQNDPGWRVKVVFTMYVGHWFPKSAPRTTSAARLFQVVRVRQFQHKSIFSALRSTAIIRVVRALEKFGKHWFRAVGPFLRSPGHFFTINFPIKK